jgi:hypothetical protein
MMDNGDGGMIKNLIHPSVSIVKTQKKMAMHSKQEIEQGIPE